jgi:hypothetical protein
MEERMYGTNPMMENRRESNEKVDRKKRYRQILGILKGKQMTAKEISVVMKIKGYTNNDDRNNAAPRLTELCISGEVEPVGKKKCQYTGKMVTVYEVRNG